MEWESEANCSPLLLQCRLVHRASDKCAFIRTNCVDHEIGLLSYLRLYYCDLGNANVVAFLILALWLALLFSTVGIAASDFLCINLSTIASVLGMSESLTGVTFLAFGNGSPDVFSTFAAMSSNSGSLAIGELVGAACFISAVVAGSMALVRPFRVARRSFVRDVGFFIVAASLSLVFLADGKLHVWECVAMIAFYLIYVVVVVSWHWYLGRQRRKRERDIAARAHFHIPENQELDIEEEPEDDDHQVGGDDSRPVLLGASTEDFSDLERAELPAWKVENFEEDDETRDRYLAELQGNMRISRAPAGQRGSSIGAIRPSLVGALEFRSVLSSLRGSRNFRSSTPIHLRRYSDDPTVPADDEQDGVFDRTLLAPANRGRPVSAYEQPTPRQEEDEDVNQPAQPVGLLVTDAHSDDHQNHTLSAPPDPGQAGMLYASPTSSNYPSRSPSPAPPRRSDSPNLLLAPPQHEFRSPDYQTGQESQAPDEGSSGISPRARNKRQQSRPTSPTSPTSPFPPYQDEVGQLRSSLPGLRAPPSISAGSIRSRDELADHHPEPKPPKWWPNRLLPSPAALIHTLFPTMSGWKDRTLWDKLLGIAAAPSVFVLTMTLPVVEPAKPEAESAVEHDPISRGGQDSSNPDSLIRGAYRDEPGDPLASGGADAPHTNTNGEQTSHRPTLDVPSAGRQRQDSEIPLVPASMSGEQKPPPRAWNRWLLAIQLVTAPLFITWAAWFNLDSDLRIRNLLLSWLVSLIVSSLLLVALFLTTKSTSTQVPAPTRPLLAFLGFVVSIAWISTLATEVVSLLKTFGVILSISDPLLGLTVFAVGNSLGDLVADITVARLGYPVMALSACFGGPMLNILIGVGVGGLYMTLHGSPAKSESASMGSSSLPSLVSRATSAVSTSGHDPYYISVNISLLVSGVTLLVTLVGLLVVVPLNGWRMDRKIGTGLLLLWTVSTVCNVIVEVVT